jgi:hypothetical protein
MPPGEKSGYHKAAKADLQRLEPQPDDAIVAYDADCDDPRLHLIERASAKSPGRWIKACQLRPSHEISGRTLSNLVGTGPFESIFCGDVVFYRAVRELFPEQPIRVRFHNLFSLVASRQRLRRYPINFAFRVNLVLIPRLEQAIFRDRAVQPIFITEQERQWYKLHYSDRDSDVWSFPAEGVQPAQRPSEAKLVIFGSMASHKVASVRYCVDKVIPRLQQRHPNIPVHLFGGGTKRFDAPDRGIYGHGFYTGDGLPMAGEGLFLNPDLLGGGIKVKVADLLAAGVPFLSTPFGVDGYTLPDSDHLLVEEIEDWPELIEDYFKKQQLL